MANYNQFNSSQNNYGNANMCPFTEQQRFGYQNPQQNFSSQSSTNSFTQHSTGSFSSRDHSNLPWNDFTKTDSLHHQNMPFVRPSQGGCHSNEIAFHSDRGRGPKPFPPPLAPPPMPPPMLPVGGNRPPPFYPPPCPPRFPGYPSQGSLCPPRFPPGGLGVPSPGNLQDPQLDAEFSERLLTAAPSCGPSAMQPRPVSVTEDEDQDWVRRWTAKLTARLGSSNRKASQVKVCRVSDVQKKLLKYVSLIIELEQVLEQSSTHETKEDLVKLYEKSERLKQEIVRLGSFFEDEKNVRGIKDLLDKRRERRLKSRTTRKVKAEKRRKLKEKWKEKERMIDQQLKEIYEKEKNKIVEEKVKKEADIILREVRAKQEEVHRMQKLLVALSQVREARIKKGDVHGYVTSPQANAFFDKVQDEFGKMLPSQLDLYRGEEQTLRVMMEESKTILHGRTLNAGRVQNVEKLQRQMYELLFGKKVDRAHCGDFQRSFTAAEESIEMLINRRHDWDKFLVAEDSPMGSSVPVGWVAPNPDPNSEWTAFQQVIIV